MVKTQLLVITFLLSFLSGLGSSVWANPTSQPVNLNQSEAGFGCINGQCGQRAPTSNILRLCEELKSRAAWSQDWQCNNVAVYDEDDRKSITTNKDPKIDAISDVVGVGTACGGSFTGTIVKRQNDDADYIVVPAHGFFDENGQPILNKEGKSCGLEEMKQAKFFPNVKYLYMGEELKSFATRPEELVWPPINLQDGKAWGRTGEDVFIFKVAKSGKKLSEEIMPNGRKRGYAKYFTYNHADVNVRNFSNLARVSFHYDSARPLEQSYQVNGIEAHSRNGVIYDTSDTWTVSSGSPLLADVGGQTAILGHVSTAAGDRNGELIDRINTRKGRFDWNANVHGSQLAKKYNLESVNVDARMASLKTQ